MFEYNGYPILTADEAAALIPNGATIGFSGFTAAGAAKALPPAIARQAKERHAKGEPYQVRVFTGASTGPNFDDVLAEANAISFRAPYQSSIALRKQINAQEVEFVDMHLSHVTQHVYEGFYGAIDFAVVEATEVTRDGRAYLTTSIGVSPTYLKKAQKIIFEINRHHHPRLREMADIAYLSPPPGQDPIAIHAPMTKIGWPYASFNPDNVIGIVETDEEDHVSEFSEPDQTHMAIARHVVDFILAELKASPDPGKMLPFQSGVGNVANAVMSGLGNAPQPSAVLHVHRGVSGCAGRLDRKRKTSWRQHLQPDRHRTDLAADLSKHGFLCTAYRPAAPGSFQPPECRKTPGGHLHEHGTGV